MMQHEEEEARNVSQSLNNGCVVTICSFIQLRVDIVQGFFFCCFVCRLPDSLVNSFAFVSRNVLLWKKKWNFHKKLFTWLEILRSLRSSPKAKWLDICLNWPKKETENTSRERREFHFVDASFLLSSAKRVSDVEATTRRVLCYYYDSRVLSSLLSGHSFLHHSLISNKDNDFQILFALRHKNSF
jgi:hypothetical protein